MGSEMTNTCDFCNDPNPVHRDEQRFFLDGRPVLWDGYCRTGSEQYFKDLSAEDIVINIQLSDEAILAGKDSDDPTDILKVKWIDEEVDRAKRELLFRLEDGRV